MQKAGQLKSWDKFKSVNFCDQIAFILRARNLWFKQVILFVCEYHLIDLCFCFHTTNKKLFRFGSGCKKWTKFVVYICFGIYVMFLSLRHWICWCFSEAVVLLITTIFTACVWCMVCSSLDWFCLVTKMITCTEIIA